MGCSCDRGADRRTARRSNTASSFESARGAIMASMPLTRRRRESALRRREGGFLLSHKDPEKARAYRAAYNTAHRKERLVYDAAYRAAHREERRAYRAAHQEEQRTYSVTWRRAHPEKRREKAHRHRARVRGQFIAPVDA